MKYSNDFLNRYKVVRRVILFWIAALITFATIRTFGYDVARPVEYGALVGLLGVCTSFYMAWRRDEERGE